MRQYYATEWNEVKILWYGIEIFKCFGFRIIRVQECFERYNHEMRTYSKFHEQSSTRMSFVRTYAPQ